jgi:hypothetical protein
MMMYWQAGPGSGANVPGQVSCLARSLSPFAYTLVLVRRGSREGGLLVLAAACCCLCVALV